jgi:hypothetical protein
MGRDCTDMKWRSKTVWFVSGQYCKKAKTMVSWKKDTERKIKLDGLELENVEHFAYEGGHMTCDMDCNRGGAMARIANAQAKPWWRLWIRYGTAKRSITWRFKLNVWKRIFSAACCTDVKHEFLWQIWSDELWHLREKLTESGDEKVANEQLFVRIKPGEKWMQKVIQSKLQAKTFWSHMQGAWWQEDQGMSI